MRIKACVNGDFNEYSNRIYYTLFDEVGSAPKVGSFYNHHTILEVNELDMDCEYGKSDEYIFYRIIVQENKDEYDLEEWDKMVANKEDRFEEYICTRR